MDRETVRSMLRDWGYWQMREWERDATGLGYPSEAPGAWLITRTPDQQRYHRRPGTYRNVEVVVGGKARRRRERIRPMVPEETPKQTRSRKVEPEVNELPWSDDALRAAPCVRSLPIREQRAIELRYVYRMGRGKAAEDMAMTDRAYRDVLDRAEAMVAGMLLAQTA